MNHRSHLLRLSIFSLVLGTVVTAFFCGQRASYAQAQDTPPTVQQTFTGPTPDALVTVKTGIVEAKLTGLLHVDGNFFIDDEDMFTNEFSLRRARPQIDGKIGKLIAFRLMPEFGRNNARILDAWANLHLADWFCLRVGKFKSPVGLQFIQGVPARPMELGLPSQIVPRRDVGVQMTGTVASGLLVYHLALLNGSPDGTDWEVKIDADDHFDIAARLMLSPFILSDLAALKGLSFGFAGTWGKFRGKEAEKQTGLNRIRSVANHTIFRYREDFANPGATAIVDGDRYHLVPQLVYAWQRLGLMFEYALSAKQVSLGEHHTRIDNWGWLIQPSLMLTRDAWRFSGIAPAQPFALGTPGWGAVELVGRYNELRIDAGAFPIFADPERSVQRARAFGGGINWYLTQHYRLGAYVERTAFVGGAVDGGHRPAENYIMTRLQVAY